MNLWMATRLAALAMTYWQGNATIGVFCKPPPCGHLLSKGGDKPLFDNIHSDKYRKLHSTGLLPQINIRKSPFERGSPPQADRGLFQKR